MKQKLSFLFTLLTLVSLVLSACAGATPAPAAESAPAAGEQAAAEEPSSGLGDLPRNETLIADILTGRVGSPDDFNNWVGW
ncbi:MAG: ABC transporter substrate-binding protein, partial [Caldilineaceae bacterium]|nr:ABC transporter substrate-binding protein [Caldilineaceae bacterium]